MQLSEGRVIAGKFRLERCIGYGAMGSVWGARHLALDAPVAVKFMSPTLINSPMAVTRFEREARAAAQIRSPHVVQVLDHGVDEGMPFIVMEWLEGEDLGVRLRRVGRLSLDDAAVIVTQAAKALQAAHEAGIIHRDLKPGNIFLSKSHGDEIVKLLDFGVAKMKDPGASSDANATATEALIGTPNFMSPEQARSAKHLDHRTDIWSLGIIIYFAITGQMPFVGESMGDVIVRVCTQPLPPPSTVALDLPPVVDWFFQRACARDPDQRFQSAMDMANAFAALAKGRPTVTGPLGEGSAAARGSQGYSGPVFIPSRGPEAKRGTPLWTTLLALLMVLLLALLASKFFERSIKDLFDGL
jgi:serine/threonine-protein kinase